MDSVYYERYMLSNQKLLPNLVTKDVRNSILVTYVLVFLDLPKDYSERNLRKAILLWQLVLYAQLPLAYQQEARDRPLYGSWLRAIFSFLGPPECFLCLKDLQIFQRNMLRQPHPILRAVEQIAILKHLTAHYCKDDRCAMPNPNRFRGFNVF